MITGRSRPGERVVGQPADARQAEHDLDEQRAAADQRAEVEAEQADEGDHRGPQHVAASTRRSEIPFARAVRTKSWLSASTSAERSTRA